MQLYVGNLDQTTISGLLVTHFSRIGLAPAELVEIKQLHGKCYTSFKVTLVSASAQGTVMDPRHWPDGTIVRVFEEATSTGHSHPSQREGRHDCSSHHTLWSNNNHRPSDVPHSRPCPRLQADDTTPMWRSEHGYSRRNLNGEWQSSRPHRARCGHWN